MVAVISKDKQKRWIRNWIRISVEVVSVPFTLPYLGNSINHLASCSFSIPDTLRKCLIHVTIVNRKENRYLSSWANLFPITILYAQAIVVGIFLSGKLIVNIRSCSLTYGYKARVRTYRGGHTQATHKHTYMYVVTSINLQLNEKSIYFIYFHYTCVRVCMYAFITWLKNNERNKKVWKPIQ